MWAVALGSQELVQQSAINRSFLNPAAERHIFDGMKHVIALDSITIRRILNPY